MVPKDLAVLVADLGMAKNGGHHTPWNYKWNVCVYHLHDLSAFDVPCKNEGTGWESHAGWDYRSGCLSDDSDDW